MPLPLFVSSPELNGKATQIAGDYGFTIVESLPDDGHALVLTEQRLELHTLGKRAPGPVYVDFAGGGADWRRRHGGGRGQGVARACGLKGGATPHILDATAGLGRDAFVLASLGCHVDMIERSPVAAALLADGLARGRESPEIADIVGRMALYRGDAVTLLYHWDVERPDVIYLDPMFPEGKARSALSKKDMQAFQQVVGADQDADALLQPCREMALTRVAVKRPRHAPWLANEKPSFSLEGDSVRYDCYAAILNGK
ncbi:MAG: class I SAM-dependent methyltransferase [Burkholderiales bacterium]|nr:class I SAM-dependent methyltransferase [Burkholderiales bacterium]